MWSDSISLCLSYFTWNNVLQVHPWVFKWQDFLLLLWLINLPLCIYMYIYTHTTFSLSICTDISRNQDCLHVLTSVSKTAGNMVWGGQISLWDSDFTSFSNIPRRRIAESHGSSIFLCRTSMLFSIVAAPISIPTNREKGFPLPHIFLETVISFPSATY